MPDGNRSETTEITLAVAEALMSDIELVANELEAIPFMEEEISRSEYQRRFRAMTPPQRLAEMQRLGMPTLLRLMSNSFTGG